MKAGRRTGVILLLLGVGIPLVLFPFAQGYHPLMGFWGSLHQMRIPLWQTTNCVVTLEEVPIDPEVIQQQPKGRYQVVAELKEVERCTPASFTLPYRYPFALGVLLLVGGLAILILPKIADKK